MDDLCVFGIGTNLDSLTHQKRLEENRDHHTSNNNKSKREIHIMSLSRAQTTFLEGVSNVSQVLEVVGSWEGVRRKIAMIHMVSHTEKTWASQKPKKSLFFVSLLNVFIFWLVLMVCWLVHIYSLSYLEPREHFTHQTFCAIGCLHLWATLNKIKKWYCQAPHRKHTVHSTQLLNFIWLQSFPQNCSHQLFCISAE